MRNPQKNTPVSVVYARLCLVSAALFFIVPAGLSHAETISSLTPAASTALTPGSTEGRQAITIAHSLDYRPFCYVDDDGVSRGILIDYWELWTKKTGIAVSFVPLPWQECLTRVSEGEIDVLGGAFYSPQRDSLLDFSQTLLEIKTTVMVRRTLGVSKLDDLSGRVVAVTKGDQAAGYLARFSPSLILQEYDGFEGPARAAAEGEVDAFAMDYPCALYYLDKHGAAGDFQPLRTLYVGRLCAAVAEGDLGLLARIDDGIAQVRHEELGDIFDHWAPAARMAPVKIFQWFLISLVAIIVALTLAHAVVMRLRLRRQKLVDDLETANRRLKDAQTQLVQSEKMASLGMLVAGVAHEINTPLGAINSMHDTLVRSLEKLKRTVEQADLKDDETTRKLHKYLASVDDANRIIAAGGERVTNIVRRLRSFARLDEAELLEADIHEGLEDTLTLIHHEIKHNITVVKDYGNLPRINCYPGQLNQVFLNILINAKQSISGQGEIKISTRAFDNHIRIAISDNGHGMPPEVQEKIFDPGFTTKGVGVGTGLGLSICYQIIQHHRGRIMVDSKVGRGTTFTIVLPTNIQDEPPA